jgi:hypothetical protein
MGKDGFFKGGGRASVPPAWPGRLTVGLAMALAAAIPVDAATDPYCGDCACLGPSPEGLAAPLAALLAAVAAVAAAMLAAVAAVRPALAAIAAAICVAVVWPIWDLADGVVVESGHRLARRDSPLLS